MAIKVAGSTPEETLQSYKDLTFKGVHKQPHQGATCLGTLSDNSLKCGLLNGQLGNTTIMQGSGEYQSNVLDRPSPQWREDVGKKAMNQPKVKFFVQGLVMW